MMALTAKQRFFVDEYLKCRNATKAAIAAGYSEKTARFQGSRLLTNVNISAEIEQAFKESAMSAAEVIMLLSDQARADMGPYQDDAGGLDYRKLKADGKTHLVKKYKITRGPAGRATYEIETYDAQAALVNLGKIHGLYKQQVEVSGEIEIADDPRDELLSRISRLAARAAAADGDSGNDDGTGGGAAL